jgi:hypothetical protein
MPAVHACTPLSAGASCVQAVCLPSQVALSLLTWHPRSHLARPAPQPFCTGKRTPEGFYYVNCGVKVRAGLLGSRLHACAKCRSQRCWALAASQPLACIGAHLLPLCQPCLQLAIARGLAYAPYADLIWCETSTPDMEEAREFAGELMY